MKPVIEAQNVSFGYAGEPIFSKIGFSLCAGEFAAVIGANGAGKSTLLRLLLGELSPDEGEICLFGQPARQFRDWPKIGYVPQNPLEGNVGFPATALEVVLSGLYAQIGPFRWPAAAHRAAALTALERVGMKDLAGRLIGRLSGGQRQRVMLARALVADAQALLLDEPTAGVDSDTVEDIYRLLEALYREQGVAVLLVTHDQEGAARFAKRIFCLEQGSLLELSPEALSRELACRHVHPHPHLPKEEI